MNEGRIVLEGLHEIRPQSLLEQHRHRPLRIQVAGPDRRQFAVVAHHDIAEPRLQVRKTGRQAENRHDLRGHHNVEARAAEPDRDVPQRAVVHVDYAPPRDAADVQIQLIAMVDVIVDERRQ